MPVNPTSYFFAIEQDLRRPIPGTVTYDPGHGVRPHGTLARLGSDTGYENISVLASDVGYCTLPTDPGGPLPYPPRVQEAFAIDALVNLDPGQSAVGANWGAIKLANNDNKFSPYITGGWIADGQHTRIFYGLKTLENFPGHRTARPVSATWINNANTLQLASPSVLRQDYTPAITVDPPATNVLRNSIANGAVAGTIGSGGVMPSGWVVTAAGLTVELSSYKTALAGGTANVLRLRLHGTTTATSGSVSYGSTGSLSGLLNNEPVVQSLYMALVAGSFANLTQIVHWLVVYDATAVNTGPPQPNFMASITTALTRFFRTYTTPTTVRVPPYATSNPSVIFYWPTGSVVDFTIDVLAPQLERGTVPTAFIPTSAGDVSHGDGAVNYVWPSDMTGAVAGTPGTLPTGWTVALGPGLSQQVVAIGTDPTTGYKQLDLRISGTATAATPTLINFGAATSIDANTGQAWCPSVYACLAAGTQTGLTFSFGLQELNSTGTLLLAHWDALTGLNANVISRSRRIFPVVTNQATTRNIRPALQVSYAANAVIDITIRLMAPQCEGGAIATAFVPTSTGPVGRPATYSVIGQPVLLNEPDATNYVLSSQVPGATNATVAASTDVPAIYAAVSRWKHTRTATATDTNCGAIGVAGLPAGAVLAASVWIWVPSSLSQAKTSIAITLEGNTMASTSVAANRALVDQWQRISATATLTAAATSTTIVLRITPQLAGDIVYTSAWQLEIGSVATSFVPPAAIPATRFADLLYAARNIFLDPPYASLVPAFHGVAGAVTSDDTEVVIELRDASYWLERALLRSSYGGTGQYDGGTELTGTLKPLVIGGSRVGTTGASWFGAVNNVTPVLIDAVNLIYQVSDGPIGRIAALYEGGAANQWPNAGDVPNLYDGVGAPAGRFRTCLIRGCIQLGSQPTYEITVDVNGPSLAPLTSTCLAVAVNVLIGLCGVPANLIALATGATAGELATIGATAPIRSGCGLFLGPQDNPSGVDLMSRILAPAGLKLVACRDGLLRALVIASIPASPTIKAQLDDRDIVSLTPVDLPPAIDPPPFRFRVGYNDNYTIQTTGLSPLATTRKAYIATPNSVAQASSGSLQALARPNDPDVITGSIVDAVGALTAASAAQQIAGRYVGLWGSRRRVYGIEVPFTVGVALEYGDLISVTTAIGDLAGTTNGQVVGYAYRSEDASIVLKVLI